MTPFSIRMPLVGEHPSLPVLRLKPTASRATFSAAIGWSYRRRYTIANLGADTATLFPFAIDLGLTNSLVSGAKALASGNDLRVWINGLEVARTLVNWNDATFTTLCWIVLPTLPGGRSVLVEVVYGNPSAGTPPTLTNMIDLPAFDIQTAGANRSTNAKWVYAVAQVIGNAGKGIWGLSSGTSMPIPSQQVPGSWVPHVTLLGMDDRAQDRFTTYVATGTKYIATFNARRARQGSSVMPVDQGPDGVTLRVATKINSVRASFKYQNMMPNDTIATFPMGRFKILGRKVFGESWTTVFERFDRQDVEVSIAAATYTPTSSVQEMAFAVWSYDEYLVDPNALSDRYVAAKLDDTLEVNLDTTIITQTTTEAEVAIYEFANAVRMGGGSFYDTAVGDYQKIELGNADALTGIDSPHLACKINEVLQVDNDAKAVQIWNSGLTAKVEDANPNTFSTAQNVWRGDGWMEQLDPDWITVQPYANPLANPSADVDASGWLSAGQTAGVTISVPARDATQQDSASGGAAGSFTRTVSANTAGAGAVFMANSPEFLRIGGRRSVWYAWSVRSSILNFVPMGEIVFYDAAQAVLGAVLLGALVPLSAINTWERRVFAALVPDGAEYWRAWIRFRDDTGAHTGQVWWDLVDPMAPDIALYQAVAGPAGTLTFSYQVRDRYLG